MLRFKMMMNHRNLKQNVKPNYRQLMDLVLKAFDGSSVLCCTLDELNLQKRNMLGLQALQMSLAIQVRANRVKRKYILKKYKKSLKNQDTIDSNEQKILNDFTPIKIPNKITPSSSPIRTYSNNSDIAVDVVRYQLRRTAIN